MNLSAIGLDQKASEKLADSLNDLLANYSVFYQNTMSFHWNISGEKFFEPHIKFEDLHTDLFEKIDQVAERVLMLGSKPIGSFSEYLKEAEIQEIDHEFDGVKAAESILSALNILLIKQRKILKLAQEMNDEGTGAQMSDYIRSQEKLVWMYSSFLK